MKLIVVLMLVGGHASVRMPGDGATIVGEDGSMTVVAEELAVSGDLRELVARDVGCARVERLAVVRSGVAYSQAAEWAGIARQIAQTLEIYPDVTLLR